VIKMNYMNSASVVIVIFFTFVLFFVFTAISSGQNPSATDEEEWEFIFFFPDTTVKNPVDATNALQTFMNILNKEKGWNLRGYFFKKQRDMDAFMSRRKVEMGVFSQIYIVENYKRLKLIPFASPVRNGKKTYRKVIVVRKADGFKDIHDLKDKILATTALGEENVAFYNKVVFQGEIDVRTHFKEVLITDSLNSAIMAVLYKQADAAAIALKSFQIIRELNPQAHQKLEAIYTSAETPLSALCYIEGNMTPEVIEEFKEILARQHLDPVGQQSLMAFNVEAWTESSIEDFRETEQIINEFNRKKRQSETSSNAETAIAPSTESTQPEKAIPKPRFQSLRIFKADEKKIIVQARIIDATVQGKPVLFYSMNGEAEISLPMELGEASVFKAAIDMPEQKNSGQEVINYRVKPGDTLGRIAEKFLGSSTKYMVVARLNNLKNPNLIYVDQKLKIIAGDVVVNEISCYVTAVTDQGPLKSRKKQATLL